MKNKTNQQKKSTQEQRKYSDITAHRYELWIQPRNNLLMKDFQNKYSRRTLGNHKFL